MSNYKTLAISQSGTRRQISSSPRPCAEVQAAPEIDFSQLSLENVKPARIVPASPSYFTASPQFNDDILLIRTFMRKYASLPTVATEHIPRVAWLKLGQYQHVVGEPVSASNFSRVLVVLNRLNRIHPQLRPKGLTELMERFRRPGSAAVRPAPIPSLDEHGRAKGVGRRKESAARVYLVEGTGEILVNGKNVIQAFPRLHDRESALWPLKVTQRMNKYNVWALVQGGGVTGQAESITLALARAILVHEPALKPVLRRGKTIQPDLRTTIDFFLSWLRDFRRQTCRAEEAWSAEGKEEASMGETMICCLNTKTFYNLNRPVTQEGPLLLVGHECRQICHLSKHIPMTLCQVQGSVDSILGVHGW